MSGPTYVQAGTIAVANSAQTTLSVPYPASGVAAGDLILMAVMWQNAAGNPPSFTIPPAGFTTLASGTANFVDKYLFYKTGGASGSEGGTSITLNNGSGVGAGGSAWSAQFTQWTGVDATGSSWFESLNTTEGATTVVTGHSITTTGANRLGVHYVVSTSGGGLPAATGWTGIFDEINATSGSSGASQHHLDTLIIPSATTISAPSSTSGAGMFFASFDFALVPGTSPTSLVLLGQAWL